MATNHYTSNNLHPDPWPYNMGYQKRQSNRRGLSATIKCHALCAQSAGSQEQVTMTNRDYHALLETHAYERYTAELLFAGTRPSGIWAHFGSMSSETGPVAMAVWRESGLEHARVLMHAFACCVKWTKARWV